MWPFKTTPNNDQQLEALEERCERLEKAMRNMDIEWTQVYEKFRLLNMRVAKRVRLLEEAEESSPQGEETQPGGEEQTATGFSPSQQEAQMKVLARRSRRMNGGG